MRAMVFDRYGEPDVMRLRDVPVPEPQAGERCRREDLG
jgi:NADPH:quinone reductase-like Zn-dependent oxidoreductase